MKRVNGWENRIGKEFNSPVTKINPKRFFLEKLDEKISSFSFDLSWSALLILRLLKYYDGKFSTYIRHFVTRMFPYDPLSKSKSFPISIALLVARKDLELLPYSLTACMQSTSNEIKRVLVICPSEIEISVKEKIRNLSIELSSQVEVYADEEVLTSTNLDKFSFCSSVSKMEVLKISVALLCDENILIVDADTLLLRKRNWCSEDKQLSPVAQEYFVGHNLFISLIFPNIDWSGMGFVTHHGLFNPVVIRDLVDLFGGFDLLVEAIDAGIRSGWNKKRGFPSEWQLYGEYLLNYGDSFTLVPASFINIGISRATLPIKSDCSYQDCIDLITKVKVELTQLGSLSLHAYK